MVRGLGNYQDKVLKGQDIFWIFTGPPLTQDKVQLLRKTKKLEALFSGSSILKSLCYYAPLHQDHQLKELNKYKE
jgi:hypothetical protein